MIQMRQKHDLPYELENMPEDEVIGELLTFCDSEVNSFEKYDTFAEGSDLYLGDGKNIYQIRKRLLGDDNIVLTSNCVGVCNPEEYDAIMENEDGFASVVGYVESNFAWYTKEDGFIPSPADTEEEESSIDIGSNAAAESIKRVFED